MAKLKSGTRIYGSLIVDSTITGAGVTLTGIITATSINATTGIVTNISGVAATITTLNSTVATLTNLGGTNVNYTGVGTIATLNSTVATLTNLGGTNINYSGLSTATTLRGTNVNYTGVGTIATLNSTVATLTNLGGTNINYSGLSTATTLRGTNVNYTGVGTIATFNATTSTITNANGTNLNFSGLSTATTLRGTNVNYTGVGTIATFNATTSTITNANGTNLNFSGLSTATTLRGTNINYSGIATLGTIQIGSGIVTATSGVVTYYGDGSKLTGVSASSDGTAFNTGISSALSLTLTGIGTTALTLASTAGKQYLIYSINAANVSTANTELNVIAAFDFNGGERSYFAYNIPIPTGTSVELLKQPQILNPSDRITMRSTDVNRAGIDTFVQVYISYQEKTTSDYFGVGFGTVGIATTSLVGIYTSSTYASVIQSVRLTNRTDSGGYPISVSITSGVTTINLVDNLIVPKYASVEILDTQKRLNLNDVLKVQVDQTSTIDVQVSGKKIIP